MPRGDNAVPEAVNRGGLLGRTDVAGREFHFPGVTRDHQIHVAFGRKGDDIRKKVS